MMRLHELPFEQIKTGEKTIESRLNDEKRKELTVGDNIKFLKRPDEVESVLVEITNLYSFNNFEKLLSSFPASDFGGKDLTDLLSIYKYYSKEDESKYGVVGIEFKLI